ncbi:fimbria/pilus periplasmic chaperone [Klebsiella sp. RHBSTW-00215]|uniref:fimbria/pilus periplasmic chaperone n=1 Tax=Klebsiella sp. RHBSTW-00215 TaxID=2742640 RepID=UPI0015F359EC|nr:fimbria/pilus periplasmic chaperone [Klebsiella sp. RHBSTW-00215]MBA7933158.1 fimbria/pilus periplasmic chaperone [Klebsiella sp. RHBSTW-00215]
MHSFKWWSVFSSGSAIGTLLLLLLMNGQPALAVVNTEVTRVIFNAGESSASLALANTEKHPTLVQVWADNGNLQASPDSNSTPIVVLPPVFRMRPAEIRSLKLLLVDREKLAQDREALFWLNIYQIPPMNDGERHQTHKVVLPLRIRMKVFVRPQGVGSLKEKEGERLSFAFHSSARQLTIDNPTPWHMTIGKLQCAGYRSGVIMVAPKTRTPITLQGAGGDCRTVSYELLNDDGNPWEYRERIVDSLF